MFRQAERLGPGGRLAIRIGAFGQQILDDVEVTFALPGLGSLTVEAVQRRDIPLIQGTTLVFAAFVILLNLLIDLAYILIDPRIRFERVQS